jgi:hypothetical protein
MVRPSCDRPNLARRDKPSHQGLCRCLTRYQAPYVPGTIERVFQLLRWGFTLVCIAALVGLFYAFQGIDHLIAPDKFNPCGSITPTCAVGPDTKLPSSSQTTIPVSEPPTPLTSTTVQIVLLPSNLNAPPNTPQPSFAPAP